MIHPKSLMILVEVEENIFAKGIIMDYLSRDAMSDYR
jgi:hypothetical protein